MGHINEFHKVVIEGCRYGLDEAVIRPGLKQRRYLGDVIMSHIRNRDVPASEINNRFYVALNIIDTHRRKIFGRRNKVLPESIVLKIKEMIDAGERNMDIADYFGLPANKVSDIRCGKTFSMV